MKKIILISSLLLFLSCATTHMGNLSLVSTKEVDMGAYYIKVAENYEGRAIMNIIIFIPTKFSPNTIEEAVNDALWTTGGDFMTNCTITKTNWYIPYVYGENILSISGDVWKKSPDDIGNIDLENLQGNQHVFVFDDSILKSVKKINIKNN